MKRRSILTALTFLLVSTTVWAQGPNGSKDYYKAANGKKGQALKTALFGIIKIEKAGWTYDGLKTAYMTTDTRPDGYLRDWYSKITYYEPGSNCASTIGKEGDGYNREHLVPQSWFNKNDPMRSDAFHVVPTDAKVNNMRSDFPFGEVGTISDYSNNYYCKKGKSKRSGYTGIVFEPGEDVKGDIARAYFYMVTCYQDKISSWASNNVFDGNTYPGLTDWTLKMMMEWSTNDPVDDVETARNEAIYNKQRNRNPFIDYPGLEEYVWGSKKDQAFSYDNYDGTIPDDPDPDDPDPDDPDPDNPDPTPGTGDFAKVTTNSQVKAGYEYIVVNEANNKAMGALNGKIMTPVDVTISNDYSVSPSESVVVLTLGGSTGAWSLKGSEGYLTSTSTKTMAWVSSEANVWTISSDDVGYTLSKGDDVFLYNQDSPRFTTYSKNNSTGSFASPAVLYYRTISEPIDPPTGIESMKSAKISENAIYNLRGQQMKHESLPKGIYIRDGKKFVVK